MKKIILCTAIFLSVAVINNSSAQIRVSVNVNIGSQPNWGPVGYDYVEYYYLPDIEAYYYVPTRQFIYLSGGNWVFTYSLPARYGTYDLYSGYKVVINQPKAYLYYPTHKVKYAKYKGNHSQVIIIKNNEAKYKRNGHDNGNHHGNGKGRN